MSYYTKLEVCAYDFLHPPSLMLFPGQLPIYMTGLLFFPFQVQESCPTRQQAIISIHLPITDGINPRAISSVRLRFSVHELFFCFRFVRKKLEPTCAMDKIVTMTNWHRF